MKFLNESEIIEVKQDRNHEYPMSNDSASTPEREACSDKVCFFKCILCLFQFPCSVLVGVILEARYATQSVV